MNARRPILVAGMGNMYFGDYAFGSDVARGLLLRSQPEGVSIEDFGVRSHDLASALMEGCDAILINAIPRGETPGTLFVLEPEPPEGLAALADDRGNTEAIPGRKKAPEVSPCRLILVGCEPDSYASHDGVIGLSKRVEAAIPQAIKMVESLIDDLRHERGPE